MAQIRMAGGKPGGKKDGIIPRQGGYVNSNGTKRRPSRPRGEWVGGDGGRKMIASGMVANLVQSISRHQGIRGGKGGKNDRKKGKKCGLDVNGRQGTTREKGTQRQGDSCDAPGGETKGKRERKWRRMAEGLLTS